MKDDEPRRVNLLQLHTRVDAEIALAESGIDPEGVEDPDARAYDIRLHTLRDAIETAALYDDTGWRIRGGGAGWRRESPTDSHRR